MTLARRRSSLPLYALRPVTVAILAALLMLTTPVGDTHAQSSVPAAPTGLTASSVSHDSVTLGWDDSDDDTITGYLVLRRDIVNQAPGTFSTVEPNTGSAATEYTDSTVSAETRYVYRVRAINVEGVSDQSNYVNVETPATPASTSVPTVTLTAPPAKPTGLSTLSVSHDSVTLSWDDPDDGSITGYQVLRRYQDGDDFGDGQGATEFVAIVGDTGSSATAYTDTSVTPRTRYVYRVKAINSTGLSERSTYLNVETPVPSGIAAPGAPTGLTAASATHESVTLSWDDPGDASITGYRVLRRSRDRWVYGDGHGARAFVVVVPDTGSSATTYVDTSVESRTRYVYRVKAINPAGTSAQSGYSNVETPVAPVLPATPTGLNATLVPEGSVTLGWHDPRDSSITGYQVLRGAPEGDMADLAGFVVIVDDTGSATTTYTYRSDESNTRYAYAVKARNNDGLSEASNVAVSGPPLRAFITKRPRHFTGTNKIEVSIAFSEAIAVIPAHLRKYSFAVTNAYQLRVSTLEGERWEWKLTMRPDGSGPVSIRLIANRACDGDGAICTADGRRIFEELVVSIPMHQGNSVYLTFDDGPDPVLTPEVLDVLARHGARATFFVTGANALAHPDLIARIVAEGHTLANHTWGHDRLAGISLEQFNETVLSTQRVLGTHATPCLRPPGFDTDRFTHQRAEALGLKLVWQTFNPKDWTLPGISLLAAWIVEGAEPGAIIVLHDHGDIGQQTPRALDIALKRLQGRPISFEPVCVRAPNSPASGAPTISGSPQVGQTLTADTSGISDPDGLTGVTFNYQWLADDNEISGATSSTYTLVNADEDRTIKVRVLFSDGFGNAETLTSAATGAVARPAPIAVLEGEITAGQHTDIHPVQSGYAAFGDLGGTLSPDQFALDGTTYTVQFLVHSRESLWLGTSPELPADFTLVVGEFVYLGNESKASANMIADAGYWWPSAPPDWLRGEPVPVGLTIKPGDPLGNRQKAPVTGYFRSFPSEHDGSEGFSFRVHFSEGVTATAEALRDHVLAVSGGTVSGVEPVRGEGRIWAVSVTPDSLDPVTVEIEAGLDCALPGAVCTTDGRSLFNRMVLTVEPLERHPATGVPTIGGTLDVGETLTADTSGIADDDGMTGATFSYQWVSYDGTTKTDIQGATDSTYTLVPADEGKALRVRVSFIDDAGFHESLTSALALWERPYGLTASESDGATVLTWKLPVGWPYRSTFQILRNRPEQGETEPLVHVRFHDTAVNTYTDTDVEPGVLYVYRVKGVDPFGYTGEASAPVEIRTAEEALVEKSYVPMSGERVGHRTGRLPVHARAVMGELSRSRARPGGTLCWNSHGTWRT